MKSIAALADDSGVVASLALDHRDAFANALARAGVLDYSADDVVETKARVVASLAVVASAVLLDQRTASEVGPLEAALVLPLEAQGATTEDGGRLNRLEFSAAENAEAGAAACKLLVHYRSDHEPTAARQQTLVRGAVDECRAAGLPLVLEPIVYRLASDDDPAFDEHRGELVVAAARDLSPLGPGVMKMEYPGDDLCVALTEACSPVGWVLLGGGDVDGDVFISRLQVACAAGASGFMAGRVLWGALLGLAPADRQQMLETAIRPLFARLKAVAQRMARPLPA